MLSKSNFKRSRNRLEGVGDTAGAPLPHVPEKLCVRCKKCNRMLFESDLAQSWRVCPVCGHHFRLSARSRIASVCDESSFTEWDETLKSTDPLEFPGYAAKLRNARLQSREREAVITGSASIGGVPCALFVMEGSFMMGSMGSVVGEKITRVFENAIKKNLPVVGFTVSGGARMQEGLLSLMQMAKTSGAVKLHSDAGGLFITVLTDPTTGGVTASFAMAGDILLAEPGALIAFAGPRVIEQTMRQKLPRGFQRAEFLLEKGFIDAVVPRAALRSTLRRLLRLHHRGVLPQEAVPAKPTTEQEAEDGST